MWLFNKREKKIDTEFLGSIYEKEYQQLIDKDKKRALSYLRRAALLLFPLKPELWDNYLKLKNEVLNNQRYNKKIILDLKNEMEDL